MLSIDFFMLSAWELLMAERSFSCFLNSVLFSLEAVNCKSRSFVWFCSEVFCLTRSLLTSWQVFSVRCDQVYRESFFCACCSMALNFPVLTQPAEDNITRAQIR